MVVVVDLCSKKGLMCDVMWFSTKCFTVNLNCPLVVRSNYFISKVYGSFVSRSADVFINLHEFIYQSPALNSFITRFGFEF